MGQPDRGDPPTPLCALQVLGVPGCAASTFTRARTFNDVPVTAVQVLHIAMVGKYTGLSDAYLSVIKSLQHACLACRYAPSTPTSTTHQL